MALSGITVIDVSGTIATGYCGKLFADYGAQVINLEPPDGFVTRYHGPVTDSGADPERSAMHAYLSTNKASVASAELSAEKRTNLMTHADLILDDGSPEIDLPTSSSRMSICWFGRSGPYAHFKGTDAQMFAMNGMLQSIGPIEGPPLIPKGPQAQIVGGATAFIGAMGHVLSRDLGNTTEAEHLETSIFEAMLCFTDVGVISVYNTGLQASRMGINRFPPTYPLGIFPCKDGWLGVTVLTPSQWHAFCDLLDMEDFKYIPLFQSSVGRLEALDVIEPAFAEKLKSFTAEDLFYRGQEARIPLARVPTMEELFGVDQFVQRQAFCTADMGHTQLQVPSTPFRLHATPPAFGGVVASLGEHTKDYS
jgi:crotonobetainyl-CoA:carnitine CoA-transferase CaiB-like acyl-CoA transferase